MHLKILFYQTKIKHFHQTMNYAYSIDLKRILGCIHKKYQNKSLYLDFFIRKSLRVLIGFIKI